MLKTLSARRVPLALSLIAGVTLTASPVEARPGEDCEHCRQWWSSLVAEPAFDEATGVWTRAYPPHRAADLIHMKLAITIEDMNTRVFKGEQSLRLTPLGWDLESLDLNAKALTIEGVSCEGRTATFTHDGRRLSITLDPPVPVGQEATLVIHYTASDPPQGLVWNVESKDYPGRAAQLHTQGQPETNSYWFPCHDFPNDRLTTELEVTVPAGYVVSSNGKLLGVKREARPGPGTTKLAAFETFHWLQDKAHVSYLVSLVVGKFDMVDLGTQALPLPVYVPPGRGGDVARTYAKTAEMIEIFGKLLDEPYPWDRYAQVLVWGFNNGGMENTSATTLYDTAIFSEESAKDRDLNGLISHELAHQWFGDLITCNSWEHVWLNEGWATYMTALWQERTATPLGGREVYDTTIRAFFDGVIGGDTGSAPDTPGMASKVYTHPWETFRRGANPYGKGASILHMLRRKLGDEAFFAGVRLYIDRHKFTTVETADFRRALEEASGESLERFFWQWCERPGVPTVVITQDFDPRSRVLTLSAEQKQVINGDNPAFALSIPVWIATSSEPNGRWITIEMDAKAASATATLDSEPTIIAVDPELTCLMSVDMDQSPDRWMEQVRRGPTHAAKLQAIRALGKPDRPGASDALLKLAMDNSAHESLRAEAAGALANKGDLARVETLALARLSKPGLRENVCRGLARVVGMMPEGGAGRSRSRVVKLLSDVAAGDRSTRVRAAAIRGLGDLKAIDALGVMLASTRVDSQDDEIRQAALDALAATDAPEGLSAAMKLAKAGTLTRTRANAVSVIGRLAKHNPDEAEAALIGYLGDYELRVVRAAGEALAEMGSARAVETIDAMVLSPRSEETAWMASAWLKTIREKRSGGVPSAAGQ
ncbi:MAG: HEAT repeat domain-containing protein [Phycisphaerae bacterium]|nr:HEAT repeat domain-containing protein [Phycisphaerae bacterium]